MLLRKKYLIFDEFFSESEDYSWAFMIIAFMKDKSYFGIYPERPRLQHIGKKGITANVFSNERNENLGFTELEEVNRKYFVAK